jgi:hypothetical protein
MNTTFNLKISVPRLGWQLAGLSVLLLAASFFFNPGKAHAAACTAPATDYGSVTSTVSISTTGTYRVWSRIMAPDSTNNSYLLEIDGNTCFTVGDSAITANTWTWVDYQNGTANSKINASLTAGNHTIKMIGREPDVKLDRVVFTADTSCVPSGTGDNCANPGDTTNPTVSMTAPANNSTISGTVNMTANASDDTGVTKVEFYNGFSLLNTDTTPPYSYSWNTTTATNGTTNVFAKAYDAAGNVTTSSLVAVTINNTAPDTTKPVTSLTAPVEGASIKGTIAMSATASDNVGVTKVEFYQGFGLIGTDSSGPAPYTTNWNTTAVPDGSYNVFSKAYDAAGNQGDSMVLHVTVDNTAPTTSITAPNNGSVLKGTANITANAADNVDVTKVELYIDGVLGATDVASPYSFNWNTTIASNGTHTLTTKAYDAAGNVTTSSAATVTVDNAAPSTSLTAPAPNAILKGTYNVTANASDSGSGVSKVEFYVDGTLVGAPDTASPFSFSWNTTTATNATHSLTVRAYDNAGNVTTSSAVNVTVDNIAPIVSMTAPANGATVSGKSVALSANASDTGGSGLNRVEFYRGAALLGSDTSSPYSTTWDSTAVANGSYALTAVALDNAGNTMTSTTVNVTVSNTAAPPPDTTAPNNVAVTAPVNGATVAGSTSINGTAADNVGVTKMELYIDNSLVGSPDTTSPYVFNWVSSTVTDGQHTIKVKAYDAAGNSTTSSAITVTVTNAGATKNGDITGDGKIDVFDLSVLARNWLSSGVSRSQGDLNGDGVVNIFDLSILANNWGK